MTVSRPPLLAKIAIVFAVLIAAIVLAREAWRVDDAAMEETRRRGAPVVAAIEAYRRQAGHYPADLADLTSPIPLPAWGDGKWRYRLYPAHSAPNRAQDEFELMACADDSCYPVVYFTSRTGKWSIDS